MFGPCTLMGIRRSLTGAWIETGIRFSGGGRILVAPLRGRGLKLYFGGGQLAPTCRSLTGAWIETAEQRFVTNHRRRSLTGAWIETTST